MNGSIEINFDGIIGPTHNYGGLSDDNTASMLYGKSVSNPKKAALQGLKKMHTLMSLGVPQAFIPPQERPFIPILKNLGFTGTEEEILEKCWKVDPKFLIASASAASMWVANAATISPSVDSLDERLHFTPANLITKFHRSFEASFTGRFLYSIFNHPAYFAHHPPLPYHADFADEGAANHTRFCKEFGMPGVQLFVYGRSLLNEQPQSQKYMGRQTDLASQALARMHRLPSHQVVFAQQNPKAIDAGVFHNDVISVGHQNVFFYHQHAFVNTENVINEINEKIETVCHTSLIPIEVKEHEVSLNEAVKTYLFNSQIITLSDSSMALVAPMECQLSEQVNTFLNALLENKSQPIRKVIYQDIRESMQNGGGPACLRLRIVLTPVQYQVMHQKIILTEERYQQLVNWVEKYYRDRLTPDDLKDPQLLKESRNALDAISNIIDLGPLYLFQQMGPIPTLPEKRS